MSDQKDNRSGRNGQGGGSGQGPGGEGGPPQGFMSRGFMGWVIIAIIMVVMLVVLVDSDGQSKKLTGGINEFVAATGQGGYIDKSKIVVTETDIRGAKRQDAQNLPEGFSKYARFHVPAALPEMREHYIGVLAANNLSFTEEIKNNGMFLTLMLQFGPIFLLMLLIWFFVFRPLRSAGGGPGGMLGSFGRSKHKMVTKEMSNVMLSDVAGITEAKDEVSEVIEFLRNPKKFQRLGGRVPRGVLLIGRPGCGKTLLAKAMAGEAEVPFFSISGSDFVEMFVGVGASRVRDLFKQAKESSPCIIFLDEIDAVGRKRGTGTSGGGHDEREQTLNAILVEMDGFDSDDQVIVVAATNRADVLDPALVRPGRFDRQIDVPLPDIQGRFEILKVHVRKIKMGPEVELLKIAQGTPMFSGAELAAIVNEAAIGATLANKDFVELEDLEEARDKVRWGRSRKSQKVDEDEKKIIAYHEAGHAMLMVLDKDSEPLHKVTIIPRAQSMGAAFMLSEKDRHISTRNQLLGQLRVTFGGRIGEEMFCGDISSGASMDIRQATSIAKAMVLDYGMSDRLGFQTFSASEHDNPYDATGRFSPETARVIDEEVKRIIDECYAQARKMLEDHKEQFECLAKALLKYETLTRREVERVLEGKTLDRPTVSELVDDKTDKGSGDAGAGVSNTEAKEGSDGLDGMMPSLG